MGEAPRAAAAPIGQVLERASMHAIASVQLAPQVEAEAVPTIMAGTTTTSKPTTSERFARDLRGRSHASVDNWRAIDHSSGLDLSGGALRRS